MIKFLALLLGIGALSAAHAADDLIDRIDEALTFSMARDQVRARLSGTLDLESYYFRDGPPGLIYSDEQVLFNPRLTFFLDGQLGGKVYVFVQTRIDRGFDPSDHSLEGRLDEYALRYTPWEDGHFQLQIGKFGTVVGNWIKRHLSWDNPFVGAPLAYESLTGIWDSQAAPSFWQLRSWAYLRPGQQGGEEYSEKGLRLPILWGPSYATGAAISGTLGHFEYAAEVKNASLSSRPEQWNPLNRGWENPTFSGRIGYRPSPTWNFGLSASEGSYLNASAKPSLAPQTGLSDYRQIVIGHDVSFEWRYWQIWAEIFAARFEIPLVGNADVYSYYVEAKYKFTPQFFGALRWNQQWFGHLSDDEVGSQPWGRYVSRVDLAGIYRLTENVQLKLQYSFQHSAWGGQDNESTAVQLTVRF